MTEVVGSVCDFCHAPRPVVSYPVPRITGVAPDGQQIVMEQGTWAACADCRPLVEARDAEGLSRRADATYGESTAIAQREAVRLQIRHLYEVLLEVRGLAVSVASWPEWVA